MVKIKKLLIIITLLFHAPVITCFSQVLELRGVVRDDNSGRPLSDVRIFVHDTVQIKTNAKGEFRVSAKESDRIRFWKIGYEFQTFRCGEISNRRNMRIRLQNSSLTSKGMAWRVDLGRESAPTLLGIILDGVRLSPEEWNDVNIREVKIQKAAEFSEDGKGITLFFVTR